MGKILKISVTVALAVWASGLLDSPASAARGKKRGPKEQAPIVMAVGEVEVLDGRFIKSPRIENPAIVKVIRHRKKNRWILKARKRGVTYMIFSHAYSPQRKARKKIKLKIVVR
jgi:hypothetical protein